MTNNVGGINTKITADASGFVKAVEDVKKSLKDAQEGSKQLGDATDGLKKRTEEAARGVSSFGSSLSDFAKQAGVFKVMDIAVSTLSSTFKAMVTDGIQAASSFNETTNVLQVSFGQYADEVSDWSETMANALGRSVNLIRGNAAEMGALLAPTLQNADATRALSQAFTTLAVDAASFFNKTDEQAFNAIRSGIIGSTQPLQQFGVVLNETAIEAAALELGINKTVQQMSEQEKIAARSQAILTKLSQVQGDAAKTADGYANQLKALNAETEDLAREIGQSLVPILSSLISWFNEFRSTTVLEWVAALSTHLQELRVTFTEVALASAKFFRASKETISALEQTLGDSIKTLESYRTAYADVIKANEQGAFAAERAAKAQEAARKTYEDATRTLRDYAKTAKDAAVATGELSGAGAGSPEVGFVGVSESRQKQLSGSFKLQGGQDISNLIESSSITLQGAAFQNRDDAAEAGRREQMLNRTVSAIGALNPVVGQLSTLMSSSGDIWTLIINLLVQLGDAIFGVKDLLGESFEKSIALLQKAFEPFIEIVQDIFEVLQATEEALFAVITPILKALGNALKPFFAIIVQIVNALLPLFKIVGAVTEIMLDMSIPLKLLESAARLLSWIFGGLAKGIESAIGWISKFADGLRGAVSRIGERLGNWLDNDEASGFFQKLGRYIGYVLEYTGARSRGRGSDGVSIYDREFNATSTLSQDERDAQGIRLRVSEREILERDIRNGERMLAELREVYRVLVSMGASNEQIQQNIEAQRRISEQMLPLYEQMAANLRGDEIRASVANGAIRGSQVGGLGLGGLSDVIASTGDVVRDFAESVEEAARAMRGEMLNIPTVLNLAATRFAALGVGSSSSSGTGIDAMTNAANAHIGAAQALRDAADVLRGSVGGGSGLPSSGGINPRLRFGNPFQTSSNPIGRF
jgi:hypothetical protein